MQYNLAQAFKHGLKAWGLLALAMIPAVVLGSASFFVVVSLGPSVDGRHHRFGLGDSAGTLVLVVALGLMLTPLFAFLATPFVPFRRWIVRGTFPFLRPGYLAVMLYGPIWLALAYQGDDDLDGFWLWSGLYEIVALAATLIFARVAHRVGAITP